MGGQMALRYLLSDNGTSTFDYAVLGSPLLAYPATLGISGSVIA